MGWIQHGEIGLHNDEMGGDVQVGRAASVRFIDPEKPGARVTIYAYPVARELDADERSVCLHKSVKFDSVPSEHMRCSWDMNCVGVQSSIWLEISKDPTSDPDAREVEFSDLQYEDLDTRPFSGSVAEILTVAEGVALGWIRSFDPNRDIAWDGKPF